MVRRRLRTAAALVLVTAVAYFFAFKRGWAPMVAEVFAAIVAVLLLLVLGELALTLADLLRGRGSRPRGLARAVLLAGLLLAGGGGLANWMLGYQGFVVLEEGQRVALDGGKRLEGFARGPLARLGELQGTLGLARVDLRPVAGGGFLPRAVVIVGRPGAPEVRLEVHGQDSARLGPLRVMGGAFGFTPRIVVTGSGGVLFDRWVPFRSRLEGRRGLAFGWDGAELPSGLELGGEISLEELDQRFRGHPLLKLWVRRRGQLLGSGELRPGHAVSLGPDVRVLFAGLRMWEELVVVRRSYPRVIRIGLGLVLLGVAGWVLAWLAGR